MKTTLQLLAAAIGFSLLTVNARVALGDTQAFIPAPTANDVPTSTSNALASAANLIRSATLSSSSTDTAKAGNSLENLRDKIVLYYSDKSWISTLQEGAKVRATWGSPQTVDRVWLFGSATILSSINKGRLNFSDGSTSDFGPVPDRYEVPGLEISFPAKSVTWVEVEVLVSRNRDANTKAVIGEIGIFNGMPSGVNHVAWNQPLAWNDTPPAGCPFPSSGSLSNVVFTGRHIEYEGADTWYPTWASDDNLYSPYADGNVRGNEISCFGGNPETGNIKITGSDPMDLNIIYLGKNGASAGPQYDARYPCGSLFYNGVWYYGTYVCNDNFVQYTEGNGTVHDVNWQYVGALCGFRTSTDYGVSWTTSGAPYPRNTVQGLFDEPAVKNGPVKFGTPHFVDFGKNMQYSPDGKAYIVGHGAVSSDPTPRSIANCSWITGDSIYLCRVTPSVANINNQGQYEFFAGMSGTNPVWSASLSAAQPIADWNNHMGCVTMTYNAPLHKYFMCVVDGRWTAEDMDTYILESDNVYGPWKLVNYMTTFGSSGYFVNIPSKFISADGKNMWLSYSANFHGYTGQRFDKPEGGRYAWCLREFGVSVATNAPASTNYLSYHFNSGTMQGWSNVMVSTAAAGYYDLAFGAARQTGHDAWGAGPNASWSVPGVTSNTNGTQWTPETVGAYFLGEVPFANQIGTTDWAAWPAASSGAQQTIMAQSPAFTLNGSGALTYVGCGSSYGVPLTTLSALPAVGGTWGSASGNPDNTKGSCAVGLLRDDGVFVLSKDFINNPWSTYTFTTAELAPYVNDGHTYTLNVVDFWSGQNSWCAIDDVNIPGTAAIPKATQTITFNQIPDHSNGDSFSLSASASSGLTVSFTVSGPASLNGNVLTCTGTGTVSITASQPGNAYYLSATPVTRSFSVTQAATQPITFNFNNGTMQGWVNTMVSTAAAGYYDLSFGPAQQTGHDNWGGGPNATWSVPGVTSNTNGTQWTPPIVGAYFLGELPFANQIGTTVWSNWPAASSGAQQTILAQSPAFTLNGSGALTYIGCGSSYGVPLTTLSALPAIGGTWGSASGNPDNTKGSCAVGLLRDDGVFVIYKEFTNSPWGTYTITATELAPYVNDGHSYTLSLVDFWSGLNSWCAIDEISIPGSLLPAAPSNLTATTLSSSQIRLNWTDNATNETSYKIERKIAGGSYSQIATAAANATSYTNTGLSSGTTYVYRVRAANSTDNSLYSSEASATTTPTTPAVPSNLRAIAIHTNQINLSWTDNANNETSFKVERKTGAGGTYAQVATVNLNVTNYADIGLAVNTQYYYRIRANNAGGDSSYSNETNATTFSTPAAPSGLIATATATNTIRLSWADSSDNEKGFAIERKTGAGGTYAQIATVNTNITTYTNTGLAVNTLYYYRVRATNAFGNSAYCAESYATTFPVTPAAPSALTATATATNVITLAWTDNATNETGFKIERKTGSGGTYAQIATTVTNVTTYTNTGLAANTQYYYRVRANNASGDSAYCTEANATTFPMTPAAPSALTATTVSTNTIRLSWTDNATNETGFKIERKTGSGGTYAQIATTVTNVTTYTNTGLTAGTTYFYKIRANNAGGDSAYCTEVSATTSSSGGSLSVPNSGFETPVLGSGQFQYAPTGGTWTFTGGSGISGNSSGFTFNNPNAPEGVQNAFLQGGRFYQQISGFSAGVTNTITFSAAQRSFEQPGQTWDVKIDGVTVGSFAPPQSATSYQDYSATFTTTTGSHEVSFDASNLNGGDNTVLIDNVRITYGSFSPVPAAPSALTAAAVSSSEIRISWTDNATNETGFKIERKTGSGGTYAQIATVGANVTAYTNTGLSATTTYYYKVRANNASGDSAYCSEANATTMSNGTLPSPWLHADIGTPGLAGSATYSSPTFTINGGGTDIWDTADAFHFVYQSWTNDVEITARVITQQNTDLWAKAGVMVRESLAANSKHAIMVLTPGYGTGYQWRSSTGGGSVEEHTGDGVLPAYWVRLVRSGNTLTGYKSSNGTTWVQTGSQIIAMTATIYVGLPVTAHNNGALSTATFDNVTVRVPADPAPSAPSGLIATAISTSQINLSWTDNANNETGFDIERKTGAGGTYAYIGSTSANVASAGDSGLSANTTYYYRVRAYNAGGTSAYCTEVSATTPASGSGVGLYGEYFSNQNLSGSPVMTRTDATIGFNWGAASPHASVPADGFSVRWTGQVQPEFSQTYTFYTLTDDGVRLWVNGVQLVNMWVGQSATEYSGTIALTAGQKYNIVIEYFDSGGDAVAQLSWSSSSTPKAVVPQTRLYLPPPPSAPATPSNLIAASASSSQINLTWTDNANNETGFKIERKTGSGGTYAQIGTVGANVTSYSSVGLSASTQYYYRVRANNTGGDSAYSGEANATTLAPGSLVPAILSQGYDDILKLQITGTPGNWLLSDSCTRQPQSGYEWWYFVGNKIVKTSTPLTNEPWNGNQPGRVLKMGAKIGLDTFNRWSNEGGWYYDGNAGMFFERADCGGVTTFMFK